MAFDVMRFLAELRSRYDRALADVDAAADELHRQETKLGTGDPERDGEFQWAWLQAVLAQHRLRRASYMLDVVAATVSRMVDRVRGLSG